ncbi:hypothetical protein QEH58_19650 [Roseibacillus persicicus]|nr:hypothetical protein [Roseibacillus persicicus]
MSYKLTEERFPKLAKTAFREASKQTRDKGLTVVQLFDGELRRIQPDGSYEVLKTVEKPSTQFRKGQKFKLA